MKMGSESESHLEKVAKYAMDSKLVLITTDELVTDETARICQRIMLMAGYDKGTMPSLGYIKDIVAFYQIAERAMNEYSNEQKSS